MANIVFLEPGTDATGGFEFYSATVGTVASDTAVTNTGSRSLKLDTGAGAANAAVDRSGILADAGRRISVWFQGDTAPAALGYIISVRTAAGLTIFDLFWRTNQGLLGTPTGATAVNGTHTLSTNTWYRISISYTITNTTTFEFRVYVDGELDITCTAGTLTRTGSALLRLAMAGAHGANHLGYFDDLYVDDGSDLLDPGNIRVTAKAPNVENTTGFDTAVGNARGASDWNNVDEVPLSETNGWQHRGVAWVANGALATNATTVTLPVVAPACSVNDVLVAYLYENNNQQVSPPDGTWFIIDELNNTTVMRATMYWHRAVAGDSGATFNFTKPTDDNALFAGFIAAYKGCRTNDTPIDATAPSRSANASADAITYGTFDPTESNAFLIAAGFYANDLTTAGAIAGTDPAFTNRADLETNIGADCSIMVYDGVSSGAATGARSHATTSTADAISIGFIFGLVPQAREDYTVQTVSQGDVNISGATIVGYAAWLWGKISSTAGAPTSGLVKNGSVISITLTTSSALYTSITTSATYPSDVAGIGMRSAGTIADTTLYECGIVVAYIAGAGGGPLIHGGPILKGSLIRGGRLRG